jgi:hypothetical protein
MLLIDGVKYQEWIPPSEDDFEQVVGKHAEDIFGKDARYFDLKHKLASKSGTGSIPDGYVITLGDKPTVQIIEFELESHSLQHIVSQMINIINGIENSTTQQKICNAIEDGINEDELFYTKIMKAIKPIAIHRFLSDNFSNTLPTINIIIDQSWEALKEAVNKINPQPRIVEFKTYTRESVGLPVHAHLFEPVYKTAKVLPPTLAPVSIQDNRIEIVLSGSYLKNYYIRIPEKNKGFFPGSSIPLELTTDKGLTRTEVYTRGSNSKIIGRYLRKGLSGWFKSHQELKAGDKVSITVIEPMKKYSLEIVK